MLRVEKENTESSLEIFNNNMSSQSMLWTYNYPLQRNQCRCIPESMIPIAVPVAVAVQLAIVFRDLYLFTSAGFQELVVGSFKFTLFHVGATFIAYTTIDLTPTS